MSSGSALRRLWRPCSGRARVCSVRRHLRRRPRRRLHPLPSLTPAAARAPALQSPRGGGPDRQRLASAESFFSYTEQEGRLFFDELDGDGDGRVTEADLRRAMRQRRLPERYAGALLRTARKGWLPASSVTWDDFAAFMHSREASTLRAWPQPRGSDSVRC